MALKKLVLQNATWEWEAGSDLGKQLNRCAIGIFACRDKLRALLAEYEDLLQALDAEEPNVKRGISIIEGAIERISQKMEAEVEGDEDGEEEKEAG